MAQASRVPPLKQRPTKTCTFKPPLIELTRLRGMDGRVTAERRPCRSVTLGMHGCHGAELKPKRFLAEGDCGVSQVTVEAAVKPRC